MKRVIPAIAFVALLGGMLFLGMGMLKTEAVPQEPSILDVRSSMRRYGRQESIVTILVNNSDSFLVFPDNQYGLKIYQRQEDGMWQEIINPNYVSARIHTIEPGDVKEVRINYDNLEVGEYRVVFEGWLREDYTTFVKGETRFQIFPHPTFQIDVLGNSFKVNDHIELSVTNDRLNSILFNDSTLSMELFILNEDGKWMKLPSPLYNDKVPFTLESGQNYQLKIPPFRARGEYKLLFKGQEENGVEVKGEVILKIE